MSLLKRLIQATLAKFGYQLVRPEFNKPKYGLECTFGVLKNLGFAPRRVLDVGANKGAWTRTALGYFPEAAYTLVEPQDTLKSHVQDLIDRGCKIHWINAGAADRAAVLPLAVSHRDDSSTFAVEKSAAEAAGMRLVHVPVRTLDEIIGTEDSAFPEMVKIDAEGFDLKVLAGAPEVLRHAHIVFVEAAVYCSYENSVARVMQKMSETGYDLFDITDINRSPKFDVLWLVELSFIKRTSPLLASVSSYE